MCKWGKEEEYYQRIITQIWMWYSYKLKQPQPMVDNDCILPKLNNDKVSGIHQTWFPNLVESFLVVQMRKTGEFYQRIIAPIIMWYSYKLE